MDPNALLLPLTILLALLAALWTWLAYRRSTHPRATLIRGIGLVLTPVALYLTNTLRLLWDMGSLIGGWARHLVFGPMMTAGLSVLGVALVALVVASIVKRKGTPVERRPRAVKKSGSSPAAPTPELGPAGLPIPSSSKPSALDLDSEVADILDRRGIK